MEENAACHRCQSQLGTTSYQESGAPLCVPCYEQLSAPPRLKTWEALLRTMLAGGLAGTLLALGAAVLIIVTGRDFALYWMLVGGLLARACNLGSERRVSRGFRLLALGLLYCSIGTSWLFCFVYWGLFGFPNDKGSQSSAGQNMPFAQMLKLPQNSPTPVPVASATPQIATAPVPDTSVAPEPSPKDMGLGLLLLCLLPPLVIVGSPNVVMIASPIGILIYGLAMMQVWKGTAPQVGELTGPHPA